MTKVFVGRGQIPRARLVSAIGCSALLVYVACGQVQTFGFRYEMHLRVIKHASVGTTAAANVTVANEVWRSGSIEIYDSASTDSAVRLPDDSCGLDIITAMTETTSEPMTNDSVLVLKDMLSDGSLVYANDAASFFFWFRPSTYLADTVPVIIVPFLGVRDPFGGIDVHEIAGHAVPGPETTLAPSVWLGSRDILLTMTRSMLAHELAHLLLPSPPFSIFEDNATPFLNIMDYPDGHVKYRRTAGFSLALEAVATNDTDVRQLIEVQATFPQNQCRLALTAPNIIEIWETPP